MGSTAPLFLAFLAVHVIAGLTAVSTGAVAALARKGGPRHVRAGRWFYLAITVLFGTAAVLTAMRLRHDYSLLIIGTVAFAAATAGYQHRRRHRPGDTGHIAGMGIGYVAMLTAFYVDNGPHLPLWDRLPPLAFWLLPSVIGAPVIARAVIRARRERHQAPRGPRSGGSGVNGRAHGARLPRRGGALTLRSLPGHGRRAVRSDVWAVGSSLSGTSTSTLAEHWNGRAWRIRRSPARLPRSGTRQRLRGLCTRTAASS